MKFGKNLVRVVELSNPEWGPYWMNYKYLKKLINEIVEAQPKSTVPPSTVGSDTIKPAPVPSRPDEISKSSEEKQFFSFLRKELKKSSEFLKKAELEHKIRWERIWEAYTMLKDGNPVRDTNAWARLLNACVKFYKDVLLLENFAIMNYCGFSKILKKHDKMTGFVTRDAFMKNVVNQQNITHYPDVMDFIKKAEQLFRTIQAKEAVVPLQDEEKLFIEAIIDLNFQASRMQAEEQQETTPTDQVNMSSSTNPEVKVVPLSHAGKGFTTNATTKEQQEEEMKRRSQEISENLDAATNILVDAATRLNHEGGDLSPNLTNILSWMELVRGNGGGLNPTHSGEKEVTDHEESDGLVVFPVAGKSAKLLKRSLQTALEEVPSQSSTASPPPNKEQRLL